MRSQIKENASNLFRDSFGQFLNGGMDYGGMTFQVIGPFSMVIQQQGLLSDWSQTI